MAVAAAARVRRCVDCGLSACQGLEVVWSAEHAALLCGKCHGHRAPKIEVAQNSATQGKGNAGDDAEFLDPEFPPPPSSSNGSGSAHVVQLRNEQPLPLSAGCSPVNVPVPVPSIEKERADLFVLLDDKHAPVVHVEPKKLPHWATPAMRQVLKDLVHCSGLLLGAGDDGTVIYSVDPMARRLGLSGSTVSIALRRLRACAAIKIVKVLPQPRPRADTRVYAVVPGRPDLRSIDGGKR